MGLEVGVTVGGGKDIVGVVAGVVLITGGGTDTAGVAAGVVLVTGGGTDIVGAVLVTGGGTDIVGVVAGVVLATGGGFDGTDGVEGATAGACPCTMAAEMLRHIAAKAHVQALQQEPIMPS